MTPLSIWNYSKWPLTEFRWLQLTLIHTYFMIGIKMLTKIVVDSSSMCAWLWSNTLFIISAGMCYALTCFGFPLWPDIWKPSEWYCRSGNDCAPYRSWTRRPSPPRPRGSGSDRNGTPCSVSAGEKNLCLSRLGKKIVFGELIFLLAAQLRARVTSPPARCSKEKIKLRCCAGKKKGNLLHRLLRCESNPNI